MDQDYNTKYIAHYKNHKFKADQDYHGLTSLGFIGSFTSRLDVGVCIFLNLFYGLTTLFFFSMLGDMFVDSKMSGDDLIC